MIFKQLFFIININYKVITNNINQKKCLITVLLKYLIENDCSL